MSKLKKEGSEAFISIPTSIFTDREVSVLEAVVEFLKEKKGMRYSEMAKLLKRDDRTIWTSYKRVKDKRKTSPKQETKEEFLDVPMVVFQDRELSALEAMVEFLKEKKGMRYSEMAKLLKRDDRTIWTSYKRAKAKRNHE